MLCMLMMLMNEYLTTSRFHDFSLYDGNVIQVLGETQR